MKLVLGIIILVCAAASAPLMGTDFAPVAVLFAVIAFASVGALCVI